MRLLGAEVVPVTSGTATLKDAVSEAMRAVSYTHLDVYKRQIINCNLDINSKQQ